MSDLIDRQAALSLSFANGNYDHEHADTHFILGCEAYREWLETLPIVRQEKGKWIQSKEFHGYDNEFNRDAIACSACHVAFPETEGYRIEDMLEDFRYCPNCGADMRGEK